MGLRKLLLAACLGAGLVSPALAGGSHPARAADLSGRWNALVYTHCDVTPQNAGICQRLLLALGTYAEAVSFTSDSAGNVTYNGAYAALSAAPSGARPLCTPFIYVTPFSGVCTATHTGHGVVKSSGTSTGLPDFVENDETATFYGVNNPPLTVFDPLTAPLALFGVTAYPLDTGIPAMVGHWGTAAYLQLLGYTGPSAGVSVSVTVTHDS